jgi:hypothetical protein
MVAAGANLEATSLMLIHYNMSGLTWETSSLVIDLTDDRRFRGYVTEAQLALEATKQREPGNPDVLQE